MKPVNLTFTAGGTKRVTEDTALELNMKQHADFIAVSTPIFRKGGDPAVRMAEHLSQQAHQQRQKVEEIAARVDAMAVSLRSIQDAIAELLL